MAKRDFSFKEIDEDGNDILDAISDADKFNEWMYQTIVPFCSGKILEIGSGIGNISSYFLKSGADITLSDIRDNYCDRLKENFKDYNPEIINVNIADEDFDENYQGLFGKFNSIFSLNVIEHIKDDEQAIANCKKLLKDNGKIVTLVPAYNTIYNGLDVTLEHYKRYNSKRLKALLSREFEVEHIQYFNFIGIFGWFFSGSILRKKVISGGQMNIYNKLVPVFKVIDKVVLNKMGLSVVAVARKI